MYLISAVFVALVAMIAAAVGLAMFVRYLTAGEAAGLAASEASPRLGSLHVWRHIQVWLGSRPRRLGFVEISPKARPDGGEG